MKHNVLGNSIFITICLSFFNSVYGQNCEERTLKKLESVYRSNLAQYKRIVRKTIQRSDEYRDSIDVAKPDWDVIYISTLPFTKRIKKDVKKGIIDRNHFLCYLNPSKLELDEAVLVCGDRFYSVWNLNPWIVTPQTPWAENITKAIQTYRPLFVFFVFNFSTPYCFFVFADDIKVWNSFNQSLEDWHADHPLIKDILEMFPLGICTKIPHPIKTKF